MDQENGSYCTINDGLLNGYKGKIYGVDETGSKNDYSYTMQKVIIENGKVVSVSGELQGIPIIANLGEDNNNDNNNNATDTGSNLENTNHSSIDELGGTSTIKNDTRLPKTGEENNVFAKWLSLVVVLGIFWILSMLLIDREKKKMNQSTTKRK